MRVKKAKKPRRSIEYLLSADSQLRKISLKKLSDRWKKAKGSLQTSRAKTKKKSPAAKHAARHGSLFPWAMSPRAMVLGVMCMLIAAALITARQPSHEADVVTSVDPAPAADIQLEQHPTAAQFDSRKTSRTPAKAPAARASTAEAPMVKASGVATPKALAVESTPRSSAVEFAPKPVTAEPARTADAQIAPTTIAGCLELANGTFRLKDTSGEDAPKSRSWKSGFLRKRAASIELADAGSLRLSRYVGQRVSVTGTLHDREMEPHLVRRIAGSCN